MRHKIAGAKLNRTTSHRKALLSNMAIALIINEQIKTTLPKAKVLRPYLEKLVTKSKVNSLANRRYLLSKLMNNAGAVNKLLTTLGPRYVKRNGGYLRIIKAGFRYGDMAPLAYIQFVDRSLKAKSDNLSTKDSDS